MKKRKYLYYILAFMIPVTVMLVMMYQARCYPFGSDFSALIGDADDQYINFFKLLYDRVIEGKSFLFSWDTGMGFDFLTNFFYYLSNPCTWIVLLFGKQNIEFGMVCSILLQVGGCSVTAMYYLIHSKINQRKTERWNAFACLVFATAYSLCDYNLAYRFNLMWMMGWMLIPLLMLGVEYLVDKNDGRLYGILLFIGFVSNFYFAWFLCIWSVICFINQKKENFRHWKKAFLKFVFTSVVSALCAAFVLVPSFMAVVSRSDQDWLTIADFSFSFHSRLGNFLNGFFWGHSMSMMGKVVFTQNNYCGIFIIVLCFVYFFNKEIERKQKVKRLVLILLLSASMNWIVLLWPMHGFVIPRYFSNRGAILLIFLLIMTAFEGLHNINKLRYCDVGVISLLSVLVYILVLFDGPLADSVLCYLITMFLFVYFITCIFLYSRGSINRMVFMILICTIGLAELLTNPFYSKANSVSYRTETMAESAEWIREYDEVQTEDGERKTTYMLTGKMEFAHSQTDVFASAINSELLTFFGKLGLSDSGSGIFYAYEGTTPLPASLFNVRYVLTDQPELFGGYHLIKTEDSYGIYETEDLAGFGFMLPETVLTWDLDEKNIFEVQNHFTRDVLEIENLFSEVSFDQVEVTCDSCELTAYRDGGYYYVIGTEDNLYYPSITLSTIIPEDMDLYVSTETSNQQSCSIYIDGEMQYNDDGLYLEDAGVFHVGQMYKGQKLEISISNMDDDTGTEIEDVMHIFFYQYHDAVMQECVSKMRESVYEIDSFDETCVSGTVNAVNDGILYTSIPYYRGFTAYVDGKETEIVKIGDAMIGVRISAGEHKVEFRYFPYGLRTGIFCSVLGLLFVVGYGIKFKKRKAG